MAGSHLGLRLIGLLLTMQEPAAPPPADTGLAIFEMRLEMEESDILQAEARLRFERVKFEQGELDVRLGAVSPRATEINQQKVAQAEAFLAVEVAERDEARLVLDLARLRAATPSPEEDVDQRRARLRTEVALGETRLTVRDAQVRAVELLLESEKKALANRDRFGNTGGNSPILVREAEFRRTEAMAWLIRMRASRKIAALRLDQARSALEAFESPGSESTQPEEGDPGDLEERVRSLEAEVESLRNEAFYLRLNLLSDRDLTPAPPAS